MHRPTVVLLAFSALTSVAHADNTVGWQAYKYVEDNDRIRVVTNDLSVEKDIGTDLTVHFDAGVDAVSGATPSWCPKLGYVNEFVSCKSTVEDHTRHSADGSVTWRDGRRNEYTFGGAVSKETDFLSRDLSARAMMWENASHNRNWTLALDFQWNTNIANSRTNNTSNEDSHVVGIQAGVNQVIDATSTAEASIYMLHSDGYLSNDYLKIVRDDGQGGHVLAPDSRPSARNAAGFALRWTKSWRPDLTTNIWYRWYQDNWGVRGNTVEAKAYWDVNPHWRINPVLRWHVQQGANFYRAYGDTINTFAATGYGTNDARQGPLQAATGELDVEYHPNRDWSFNAGVARYVQNTGLRSTWLTAGFIMHY